MKLCAEMEATNLSYQSTPHPPNLQSQPQVNSGTNPQYPYPQYPYSQPQQSMPYQSSGISVGVGAGMNFGIPGFSVGAGGGVAAPSLPVPGVPISMPAPTIAMARPGAYANVQVPSPVPMPYPAAAPPAHAYASYPGNSNPNSSNGFGVGLGPVSAGIRDTNVHYGQPLPSVGYAGQSPYTPAGTSYPQSPPQPQPQYAPSYSYSYTSPPGSSSSPGVNVNVNPSGHMSNGQPYGNINPTPTIPNVNSNISVGGSVSQTALANLMAMGFPRDKAELALFKHNNNQESAVNSLLS